MIVKSKSKSPREEFDSIVYQVSDAEEILPFTIITDNVAYGYNLLPSLWGDYFTSNNKKDKYIYDGEFYNLKDIRKVKEIQDNTSVIVNKESSSGNNKSKWLREYLPLELTSDRHILPYDPANAFEFNAIINLGLNIKEKDYIVYTSAHNEIIDKIDSNLFYHEKDVVGGLYFYNSLGSGTSDFKIIASGYTLTVASRVADWIYNILNISVEIWSCPSYTIASRLLCDKDPDPYLHSVVDNNLCNIDEKLFDDRPTIAMTRYDSRISEQLLKYFDNKYIALGYIKEISSIDFYEMIYKVIYHLMRFDLLSKSEFNKMINEYKLLRV